MALAAAMAYRLVPMAGVPLEAVAKKGKTWGEERQELHRQRVALVWLERAEQKEMVDEGHSKFVPVWELRVTAELEWEQICLESWKPVVPQARRALLVLPALQEPMERAELVELLVLLPPEVEQPF